MLTVTAAMFSLNGTFLGLSTITDEIMVTIINYIQVIIISVVLCLSYSCAKTERHGLQQLGELEPSMK